MPLRRSSQLGTCPRGLPGPATTSVILPDRETAERDRERIVPLGPAKLRLPRQTKFAQEPGRTYTDAGG